MRITIIYPSFGVVSPANQPNIKAVADNYGIYPNMSLAYVAGALQAAGHNVLFLDAMASGLSLNDMLASVKKFRPDIIMFTLTTYLFHETAEIIRLFKKEYPCKIIVGGANVTLFPMETLKVREIDIGIMGEAERTVAEVICAIEKKRSLENIKGIAFRKKGKIILTPQREKITDLDELPFPARNLLPMDKYFSFISKYKNYTIIMTSRGCPFQCVFCEQRTGDVRYRSPENVVKEIEECIEKHGVREIDIFDPLFTVNKKRVIDICRLIEKKGIKVAWSCRSRVDTIDEEMLVSMKKAGCYRLYFGIESGDEEILKNIRKFTTLDKIRKAISITKKNGILAFGYFMLGNPGESEDSIKKTIALAKELPLDYAQFSRLSTLPGTPLYEQLKEEMGHDYWKEYVLDKRVESPLPRIRCRLTDGELNSWIKRAYREFYFRPCLAFRMLKNIKSFQELSRYMKAAFSIMANK